MKMCENISFFIVDAYSEEITKVNSKEIMLNCVVVQFLNCGSTDLKTLSLENFNQNHDHSGSLC